MPFDPAELSADLPPPRDDEPVSLRQEIVDELADHLHCAYRRELLTTPTDPEEARRRVLEKFGDPVRLARQLWFESLKEQLMSQRLTTIAIGLLTLLCAGLFYFTWQSQSAHRALFEQQQTAVRQLMEQLAELAGRPEAPPPAASRPAEWNRLTIRCVYDRPGGAPAPGVQVKVTPASTNAAGLPPIESVTDAAGRIDGGFVLYGQYRLEVLAHGNYRLQQTISVLPGKDHEVELVCPWPGELVAVAPRLEFLSPLPPAWADKWWFVFHLVPSQGKPRDRQWYALIPQEGVHVVRRPDGQFLVSRGDEWLRWQTIEIPSDPEPNDLHHLHLYAQAVVTIHRDAPWSNTIQLPPGGYHIREVTVGVAADAPPPDVQLLCRLTPPEVKESMRSLPRQTVSSLGTFWARPFESNDWSLPLQRHHWNDALLALEWAPGNILLPLGIDFSDLPEEGSDWMQPREQMVVDLFVGTGRSAYQGRAWREYLKSPSDLRPLLRGVRLADPWVPPMAWSQSMPEYDGPVMWSRRLTLGYQDMHLSVRLILRREEVPYVQKGRHLHLFVRPATAGREPERGALDPALAKELDPLALPEDGRINQWAYPLSSPAGTEE